MKRNYNLDFLKFICSFLVICAHAPIPGLFGDILLPFVRVTVPLFFMITGYYYSHSKERGNETGQIKKIAKLFAGANLLYFLFMFLLICVKGDPVTAFLRDVFDIRSILAFVVLNESPFWGHLWYLGAILYVLLIVFLFEKKWDRTRLYPLVPVLLLMDLVFGKYSLLLLGKSIPYIFVRNFLFVGLPYFLIGDMVYTRKIQCRSPYFIVLSLLFACTTLLERNFLEMLHLNAAREHYISTTFLAISVFLPAVRFESKTDRKWFRRLCSVGANHSTNIYILHPLFLTILAVVMRYALKLFHLDSISGYVLPFAVFGVSIIASYTLYSLRARIRSREGMSVSK